MNGTISERSNTRIESARVARPTRKAFGFCSRLNRVGMRRATTLIVLVLVTGCGRSELEKASTLVVDEMAWLYKADPVKDMDAAFRKGDYRFVGLYRFTTYVPGLHEDCGERVKNKDVRFIEGTSDAILGNEHAKLISIAEAYAKQYNMALYMRLLDRGQDVCRA